MFKQRNLCRLAFDIIITCTHCYWNLYLWWLPWVGDFSQGLYKSLKCLKVLEIHHYRYFFKALKSLKNSTFFSWGAYDHYNVHTWLLISIPMVAGSGGGMGCELWFDPDPRVEHFIPDTGTYITASFIADSLMEMSCCVSVFLKWTRFITRVAHRTLSMWSMCGFYTPVIWRTYYGMALSVCPYVRTSVRPSVRSVVHNPCGQDIARTIWPRMLKLSMCT